MRSTLSQVHLTVPLSAEIRTLAILFCVHPCWLTGYFAVSGRSAINLSSSFQPTGKGTSVLEMVAAFEAASGKKVKYEIVDRRAGDTVAVWAATELAEKELGWKAKYGIAEMCMDQWRWATKFPQGYDTPAAADN